MWLKFTARMDGVVQPPALQDAFSARRDMAADARSEPYAGFP